MTIEERKRLIVSTAQNLMEQIAFLEAKHSNGEILSYEKEAELSLLRGQMISVARLSLYTISEEVSKSA